MIGLVEQKEFELLQKLVADLREKLSNAENRISALEMANRVYQPKYTPPVTMPVPPSTPWYNPNTVWCGGVAYNIKDEA